MDKAVAAIVALLTVILDTVTAFYAGSLKEKLREAERDAKAVERANRAAGDGKLVSFDERVRYLQQQGRVRSVPKE